MKQSEQCLWCIYSFCLCNAIQRFSIFTFTWHSYLDNSVVICYSGVNEIPCVVSDIWIPGPQLVVPLGGLGVRMSLAKGRISLCQALLVYNLSHLKFILSPSPAFRSRLCSQLGSHFHACLLPGFPALMMMGSYPSGTTQANIAFRKVIVMFFIITIGSKGRQDVLVNGRLCERLTSNITLLEAPSQVFMGLCRS